MKIAMMGSGGVGGFFGGRLAKAGHDVTFIARGAHLAALREQGLTIENEPQGNIHVAKVKATEDPASVGPVDLVIVSVKLWDTEAAAKQVKPIVGPQTAVLSLQNGVIKDDIMRRVFGEAAGTPCRPGRVRGDRRAQRRRAQVDLGEIRFSGRALCHHDHDAKDARPGPLESADPRFSP